MTQPEADNFPNELPPTSPPPSSAQALHVAGSACASERYAILEPHAKGGLGEVFRAADTELSREVALKRMQDRHRANPESLRRFLFEATITARLEHPGIVPIHGLVRDADGQPSYAMRFIEGESLDAAIKRFHQGQDNEGEQRVRFRQLLQKFVSVCQTMSYAHSKGVIHRDLKPANIMLGPFGETLVVDWGLAKEVRGQGSNAMERANTPEDQSQKQSEAKALETMPNPTSGTEMGQALGTPQYMAPEQAAGRWNVVGPATDIYSLGAILYTLLTGQAPFLGKTAFEVMEQVKVGALRPPRRLRHDVPSPLDAICRKAMALEMKDRYTSARELADDVENWLADEPVTASREPWAARTRRWLRKHQTLVAVLGVGLVMGLTASIGALVLVTWHNSDLQAANARERLLADLGQDTMEKLTNEKALEYFKLLPGLGPDQMAFLRNAADYYHRFAAVTPLDEAGRWRQAEAYFRIAGLQDFLGEHTASESSYRQALPLFEGLATEFATEPKYRRQLADCHNNLGNQLRLRHHSAEAESAFRQAIAIHQQLSTAFPQELQHRVGVARGSFNLGLILHDQGKRADAATVYREAIRIQETIAAERPQEPDYQRDLAASLNTLANVLLELGKSADAKDLLTRAIAITSKLSTDYPTAAHYRQELAYSYNLLGVVYAGQSKFAEAETPFRQALGVREKLVADFPAVAKYRRDLAVSYRNVGYVLTDQNKGDEGEASYHKALAAQQQLVTDFPAVAEYRHGLAQDFNFLAGRLRRTGKVSDAEAAYRQAVTVQQQVVADNPRIPKYRQQLANHRNELASLLKESDKLSEAVSEYRQTVALNEELAAGFPDVPAYRFDLADTQNNLGTALLGLRCYSEAEALYRAALTISAQLVADYPKPPRYRQLLAHAQHNLGFALADQGKWDEAEVAYRQALTTKEQLVAEFPGVGVYQEDLASTCLNMGDRMRQTDQAAASLQWYERVVALTAPLAQEPSRNRTARKLVPTGHKGLALALTALKRHAEALAEWDQAIATNQEPRNVSTLRASRAIALARVGKCREAVAEADTIAQGKDADGGVLHELARAYSLAAGGIRDGQLQGQYAARAVELLRQAVAKGYKELGHLKNDEDFRALRDRDDYQKFLKQVDSHN